MTKPCLICSLSFTIEDSDFLFFEKMGVPSPTLCPNCRAQRRMSWSNQTHLHKNTCVLSGKTVISNYAPDCGYPVMDAALWYGDGWDPYATGRDFDFSRSFFEQFEELNRVAPRPNLHRGYAFDENADYTNYAGKNKNCYLIFDADNCRDCYYSYSTNACESTLDCFRVRNSELAYECIDSSNCYHVAYLQNCKNCSDSYFLKNCIGCQNCFGSINLRNKKYYFNNQPLSKEEYELQVQSMNLGSYSSVQELARQFSQIAAQGSYRSIEGVQNENVLGNYLMECKNAKECWDSVNLWDCKYVQQTFDNAKDCMDCTEVGDGVELMYDTCYIGYTAQNIRFSTHGLGQMSYLDYCMHCPNSSYMFGCVGLRKSQYCILNKKYSPEDFETTKTRIIEHMKSTGEWGEFFPTTISPFPYNETHAFDYFPMSREEVVARGWKWVDAPSAETRLIASVPEIPDKISEVGDDVCAKILSCKECQKAYKIIPGELKINRMVGLPLPQTCFQCRHQKRLAKRNPRKLWDRQCAQCAVALKTSYAPERTEKVLCDKCYEQVLD